MVLHDVINDAFARKAVEKGADGLIPVAPAPAAMPATLSPFALVAGDPRVVRRADRALRRHRQRPRACWRPQAMGADFAYIGSAFIATEEANAARRLQAT